jgi:ribonuclease HI
MLYKIYTDGGCSGNKRDAGCKGAWAFIILDCIDNVIANGAGKADNTTNNRMEMMAVIKGLTTLISFIGDPKINDCLIITDSRYVVSNYEEYVPEWKKNGWRKSGGGNVINIDLWKEICSLSPEFKSCKLQWVKGHSTNKFNQEADALVRSLLH